MKKALRALIILVLLIFTANSYLIWHGLIMPVHYDPYSNPSNSLFLHPDFGWSICPGEHISFEDPNVIETVWPNRSRASRKEMNQTKKIRIAVTGCSYTFGTGVRDEETFPWLLGERFADTSFENYAVPGFGTVQCMLDMKKRLESGSKYDLIIYSCIDEHLVRNRLRQETINYRYNRFFYLYPPYAEYRDGTLCYHKNDELRWPFEEHFILINYIKHIYLTHKISSPQDKLKDEFLFYEVLKDYSDLAAAYDIPLAVFVINCRIIDMCHDSVFFGHEDLYPKLIFECKYPAILSPSSRVGGTLEHHPNAEVHKFWAQKAGDILESQGFAR